MCTALGGVAHAPNTHSTTHVLRGDEHVLHQLLERHRRGHVVERVGGVEHVVARVPDDAGGEVVKGAHVRDLVGLRVLHDVAVDDTVPRQHPMLGLLVVPLHPQVEPGGIQGAGKEVSTGTSCGAGVDGWVMCGFVVHRYDHNLSS